MVAAPQLGGAHLVGVGARVRVRVRVGVRVRVRVRVGVRVRVRVRVRAHLAPRRRGSERVWSAVLARVREPVVAEGDAPRCVARGGRRRLGLVHVRVRDVHEGEGLG